MGAHLARKKIVTPEETLEEETGENVPEPDRSWSRGEMEAWIIENNIVLTASDYSNKKKLYSAMRKAWNALPDA